MPSYRDSEATGQFDEITVIEDPGMVEQDDSGALLPTFAFIDTYTVCAHPVIIDALIENAERLWTLEELLADLAS